MARFRVGIIGVGRPWKTEGATGFGMANFHALGYAASPDAEIVAVADLDLDHARAFQADHGVPQIYADYHEMLEREALDIVSICTWPHLHAPMVIAAAEAGVKAIHCEKPVAPTYGEAQRMAEACKERGVQLTFNHQRRFGNVYCKARELLKEGVIGELQRMEATCPNMFDWGTHWFDMLFFYNDETPVEWVIGQIDTRDGATIFGVPVEGQGISYFQYRNGVTGMLLTRSHAPWGALNRLIGADGTIEVLLSQGYTLRVWSKGMSEWQVVNVPQDEGGDLGAPIRAGVLDMIDALKTGREPELSARRALQATELIFATYESSRSRRRIDLPLTIDDSPLLAMLQDT
jgi:UDP-N-acetylglucosamine 3-dehydrogenase